MFIFCDFYLKNSFPLPDHKGFFLYCLEKLTACHPHLRFILLAIDLCAWWGSRNPISHFPRGKDKEYSGIPTFPTSLSCSLWCEWNSRNHGLHLSSLFSSSGQLVHPQANITLPLLLPHCSKKKIFFFF